MFYSGYVEQYERLGRWLSRIKYHDLSQKDHLDYTWAFFQNCYAMKEWIKYDIKLQKKMDTKTYIENEIKKYPNILISIDLGNRSKHLELSWPVGEDAKVQGVGVTLKIPPAGSTETYPTEYHYRVINGKGEMLGDGVEIASKAYAEWGLIIKDIQNKL